MNLPLQSLFRFALAAALIGLAQTGRAQGILYPRPEIRIQPFYVRDLHVSTTIHDAIAETSVEQTFVNTSSVEQEGTYLYPLPEGASPTAFSMTVGDRTMEPRILAHDEARAIYEDIVRRRRDPALLEYVGRSLVRVSVFPIPPQGERKIRLRYTEVLKPENGMHRYAYPLSTSRFGARPVGTATVSIKLSTTNAIKNIYSPTHALSVRKTDEHTALASYEGSSDTSDRDLTLYFSTNNDDVGLSLLTYRSGDRDGYFVLLASPRVSVPREKILPKQVVFVLDRTGSMAGAKIEQARKSLLYCLNSLHKEDRFDVITFNEAPDVLLKKMEPASEDNVRRARQFVENIEAAGGTNIDEALRAALKLIKDDPGTQKMIVFLTDGLPTVGETSISAILQHVHEQNGAQKVANAAGGRQLVGFGEKRAIEAERSGARIFCFGLGYDVNVPFLDRLGEQEKGDSDFIKPEEDVEVKVSAFFSKVASPILSNVKLAFEGTDVYDVYPNQLPDLFKGSQLVITGRFRGDRAGTVRLTGTANDSQETFKTAAPFDKADGANSFVPRLWAQRKIGYLVDQLRLSSSAGAQANREVIDEIVRLSREYGIITEYTSFLVDDREQRVLGLNNGIRLHSYALDSDSSLRLREEVLGRAGQFGVTGAGVTDQSGRAKDLKNSDQVTSRYQSSNGSVNAHYSLGGGGAGGSIGGMPGSGGPMGGRPAAGNFGGARSQGQGVFNSQNVAGSNSVVVQAVGDRTFYHEANNVWQDQSYDVKKNVLTKIQAFSDAHFALLRAVPSLAAYSSVGEEIIVRIGKNAVQIGKDGKSTLTGTELKQITGK
jgi:uncharacterized protein YegL